MSKPSSDLYGYEIENPDRMPDAAQRFPFIVYLHGIGESGGERSYQVKMHGPWKTKPFNVNVKEYLGRYFVVAPHNDSRGKWNQQRLTATLCAAFSKIRQTYRYDIIDPHRVYVTGISRGGRGALELALKGFPDPQIESDSPSMLPFTAAAIICPEQDAEGGAAERLRDQTRYQFFHRENDVNPKTRGTYSNFIGAPKANFHAYSGCNHNCWTATYANLALYQWFDDHNSQPHWGLACDQGMCTQNANVLIAVKNMLQAPFCEQHARQYEGGQEEWVVKYNKNLERI